MSDSDSIIRFANMEDISHIMAFIGDYWSKKHILANDRTLFEYQYVWNEEVHFVISESKATDELEAILGYIPYADGSDERDIFLALWKAKHGTNLFQGIKLLNFLEENGRCRNSYCAGINRQTFSIYKYMRKNVARLEHFYILNEQTENYRIAKINDVPQITFQQINYKVRKIKDISQLNFNVIHNSEFAGPIKSRELIEKKYFVHPIYSYSVFEVKTMEGLAYVIGREQQYNDAAIFRIVELWGQENSIANIGCFLRSLLYDNNYEYIDCYEYGLSDVCMLAAGFTKRKEQDLNIIPNYFEPFERENVEIYIYTPSNLKVRMFKGDGDQDRPSIVREKV